MIHLTAKDFDRKVYEFTSRSARPRNASAKPFQNEPHALMRLIARLPVADNTWRRLLHNADIRPPHANALHKAVVAVLMQGKFKLYQYAPLETRPSLKGKHNTSLSVVKGPNPHPATTLQPEIINDRTSLQKTLDDLGIDQNTFLQYLIAEELLDGNNKQDPMDEVLNLTTQGNLLLYEIPRLSNAPKPKKVEYEITSRTMFQPVPLAPESSSPKTKPSSSKNAPQDLDDCETRLKEARETIIKNGKYKSKYSDKELLRKVQTNEVSNERFLVSFQSKNSDPDAKLAFQRESGLAPLWATSFDQLEYADTDPELIAKILGTNYDPSKEYDLHIIDRGENLDQFGQNTFVPTWANMQAPTQKYLGKKHGRATLKDVMTPEYQKQYAKDMTSYHKAGLNEFDGDHQAFFAETLPPDKAEEFLARHNIRTEFGANSEFTGNGLTQSREGSTQHGVIEVLTLENSPPQNQPNEEHKNN